MRFHPAVPHCSFLYFSIDNNRYICYYSIKGKRKNAEKIRLFIFQRVQFVYAFEPDDIKKNIIYVYYTEQTVLINFKVVGPDGCGVVDPESLNLRYDSDLTGTANAVPAENYRFVGWFYNEACTNPIVTTDTLKPNGETLMLFRDEKDGWSPKTYYAKFEPAVADLTIERQNAEADQVFVYEIKNTETNDVITVTVVGSNQVTVHDLPVGNYIVTQKNDWS